MDGRRSEVTRDRCIRNLVILPLRNPLIFRFKRERKKKMGRINYEATISEVRKNLTSRPRHGYIMEYLIKQRYYSKIFLTVQITVSIPYPPFA